MDRDRLLIVLARLEARYLAAERLDMEIQEEIDWDSLGVDDLQWLLEHAPMSSTRWVAKEMWEETDVYGGCS